VLEIFELVPAETTLDADKELTVLHPAEIDLSETTRSIFDGGLTDELNRKGITGAGGGRWHRSSMSRLLTRLRQFTPKHGGTNKNLALKRVADMRAEALRSTILEVRTPGFVSGKGIARELNARAIPTAAGSKWHPTTVTRLLKRLARLDRLSNSRHRR
jgi:hypothetical protein